MNKEVKVSIILPTYNDAKYIRSAIDSILAQDYFNWELLVVDDGSIDDTEDIIARYKSEDSRIFFLKNDINLGIQKTLNIGLKNSKGEYIARIDSDDEWIDKNKLKKQTELLDNNPNLVLVGTGAIVVDEERGELFRYIPPKTDKEIRSKLLSKNCFIHSTVLFRKNAILDFCGYDESRESRNLEDYGLWLKLGTIGSFDNIETYSVKFMIRGGSISSRNKLDQFRKSLILIKKFRGKYPNYYWSLVFNYLRLQLFKIFNFIPFVSLKNKIFKFYKEF